MSHLTSHIGSCGNWKQEKPLQNRQALHHRSFGQGLPAKSYLPLPSQRQPYRRKNHKSYYLDGLLLLQKHQAKSPFLVRLILPAQID